MGYYSSLSFDIKNAKVDPGKIKEMERFFADDNNDEVSGFYGVKFSLTDENHLYDINLEEYYAKFYDDELFVQKLSETLLEGEVVLYFTGEDSTWGYRVTPGDVKELSPIHVESDATVIKLDGDFMKQLEDRGIYMDETEWTELVKKLIANHFNL